MLRGLDPTIVHLPISIISPSGDSNTLIYTDSSTLTLTVGLHYLPPYRGAVGSSLSPTIVYLPINILSPSGDSSGPLVDYNYTLLSVIKLV